MGYCCHVCNDATNYYLDMYEMLQKCIHLLHVHATSLELLVHHQNLISLNLLSKYHFGRCSSELAEQVPIPYSRGRPTSFSNKLHDFSVNIPSCYKDFYINSVFPHTGRI